MDEGYDQYENDQWSPTSHDNFKVQGFSSRHGTLATLPTLKLACMRSFCVVA